MVVHSGTRVPFRREQVMVLRDSTPGPDAVAPSSQTVTCHRICTESGPARAAGSRGSRRCHVRRDARVTPGAAAGDPA
eukprot:2338427-Rhodomonas_salina.1